MTRYIAIILVTLLASVDLAHAQDPQPTKTVITVKAVDIPDGKPVLVKLERRSSDGKISSIKFKPSTAEFVFDEDDCTTATNYRATPIIKSIFSFSSDDWRSCAPGAVLVFQFARVLVGQSDLYRITGSLDDNNPLSLTGSRTIQNALVAGDYGTATFISTEMSIAFQKAGNIGRSNDFRVLALAVGADAVQVATGNPDYSGATFLKDPAGQYGLSPEVRSAIAGYQESAGLPVDGKLNWPTMRGLSVLAQDNIEQLNAYKVDAIGGILN